MRSTYWAFYSLILTTRPNVLCDIGSCDGADAIRFKKLRAAARVLAFEANSANYQRMIQDETIAQYNVDVRHAAVTDRSGPVEFFEVEGSASKPWAIGVSSLRQRTPSIAGELVERRVTVDGVRLDQVLADVPGTRVGLWIDVEGAASEVIAGLGNAADRVAFVHVETETAPLWIGQETSDKVARDLEERGFQIIASSVVNHPDQRNLVFVSRRLRDAAMHIAAAKAAARASRIARLIPRPSLDRTVTARVMPAKSLQVRLETANRPDSRPGPGSRGQDPVLRWCFG